MFIERMFTVDNLSTRVLIVTIKQYIPKCHSKINRVLSVDNFVKLDLHVKGVPDTTFQYF